MRKNFGVQTWLYPMPVLMIGTYDENGNPDVMNAAWGGIHDTNQIGVCIDPSHKTAENLQLHQCFTVSIGDAAHVKECDYLGLVSAKDEPEKLKKAGFHAVKAENVNAPVIAELPMTLECRLLRYDTAAGCAVGEIVNISADEKILDENGKISVERLRPICFDPVHHVYRELGAVVGKAFHDGLVLK
ncbi:MAG: flavin reductase family protein [Lentisphaeria bacterium]|nr:flavin reductase family protein [Lentisphaeria bacterium]